MRYLKFITRVLIMFSMVSFISINFSEITFAKKTSIIGKAMQDIPIASTKPVDTETIKTVPAILDSFKLIISPNHKVKFKGNLFYNNNVFNIKQENRIYLSQKNSNNYILNSEKNKIESGLELVQASILTDVSADDLKLDNTILAGKTIIRFEFFNKDTNDLIIFEESLTNIDDNLLDNLRNLKGVETLGNDSYAYKIYEPTANGPNLAPFDDDVRQTKYSASNFSIASVTKDDYGYYYADIRYYPAIGGTEQHVGKIKYYAYMDSIVDNKAPVRVGITLEDKKVKFYNSDGTLSSIIYDYSEVSIGDYSSGNPAHIFGNANPHEASYADALTEMQWYYNSKVTNASSFTPSVGFSVGYYGFSYSVANSLSTTETGVPKILWEPGKDYFNAAQMKFKNQEFYKIGSSAYGDFFIQRLNGIDSGNKRFYMEAYLPIYSKATSKHITTAYKGLNLYYYRQ